MDLLKEMVKRTSIISKCLYFVATFMAVSMMSACGPELDNFGVQGSDGGNFTAGESILPDQVTIPATEPGTGVIYGKVVDATTGVSIPGVTVSTGSLSAVSDAEGAYMLVDVPYDNRVIVNTDVNGYSEQSKIVVLSESQHAVILNPPLLAIGVEVTFDPTIDQIISLANNASVALEANSLIFLSEEIEELPVGQVTANLTNVDASADPNLMPGDYLDDNGNYIESFGAISVSFTDENGNDLDLADGSTANITIPVANSSTPQDSAQQYSYSRETGLWTDEAVITLVDNVYAGEVDHFSTWNADVAYNPVTITGCVDNGLATPEPLPGTVVKVRGNNYIGTSTAIVAADGSFQVTAKENSTVLVTASNQGKISNTVEVNTGTGFTMGSCLSIREFSISVTLTWGGNPDDLDTHIVGPEDHIFFGDRGALNTAPFIALDVDDQDGFGPEVLTINQFPAAGSYIYSVHHFSGSNTISGSPARVELNFNGDTFIFAPPNGQAASDITWDVFEIVVGDDLNVVDILALERWSAAAPN